VGDRRLCVWGRRDAHRGFEAIHQGKPDRQLLSYQYLQMLPQLAQGDANKVFVIPSEFAEAFGGLSKALGTAPEKERGEVAEPTPGESDGSRGAS
jgi:hypothetical protein